MGDQLRGPGLGLAGREQGGQVGVQLRHQLTAKAQIKGELELVGHNNNNGNME